MTIEKALELYNLKERQVLRDYLIEQGADFINEFYDAMTIQEQKTKEAGSINNPKTLRKGSCLIYNHLEQRWTICNEIYGFSVDVYNALFTDTIDVSSLDINKVYFKGDNK